MFKFLKGISMRSFEKLLCYSCNFFFYLPSRLSSNSIIYFFLNCQTLINVLAPAYRNKQMVAAETKAWTDFIKIALRQVAIRSVQGQPFLCTDRSLPLKHLFFAWCRGSTAWVSKALSPVWFGSRLIIFNHQCNLYYQEQIYISLP